MIVLDTDIIIEIFDKNSTDGDEYYKKIIEGKEPFCTTALNLHEVRYCLEKHARQSQEILDIPALDCTAADAILSSSLELKSERRGKKVCGVDAMIAAIVINNGGRLFTLNPRRFDIFKESGLRFF